MQLDVWIMLVRVNTRGVQTQPLLWAHPTPPFSNIPDSFMFLSYINSYDTPDALENAQGEGLNMYCNFQ